MSGVRVPHNLREREASSTDQSRTRQDLRSRDDSASVYLNTHRSVGHKSIVVMGGGLGSSHPLRSGESLNLSRCGIPLSLVEKMSRSEQANPLDTGSENDKALR